MSPHNRTREGFAVPFIEYVTHCPFETVIDRTATDDSQLNAGVLDAMAMHAHKHDRNRSTEMSLKAGPRLRETALHGCCLAQPVHLLAHLCMLEIKK